MGAKIKIDSPPARDAELPVPARAEAAFGEPRYYFDHRFVYLAISQRAGGLCIGINLNPDQACNFNCVYCEVKRGRPAQDKEVNVKILETELRQTLEWVHQDRLPEFPCYQSVPRDLLRLQAVLLSGDGEPTLCPNFAEVVRSLVHQRALNYSPLCKLVLVTNGSGFHQPEVQEGLRWFNHHDEVWVKLDAGTPEYLSKINRSEVPLSQILSNLLLLGRQRPIVIQSLFPLLMEQEPADEEIDQYTQRLKELKAEGAQIQRVQIYSAHRPTALPGCGHLSLPVLSRIALRVRESAGVEAEVF